MPEKGFLIPAHAPDKDNKHLKRVLRTPGLDGAPEVCLSTCSVLECFSLSLCRRDPGVVGLALQGGSECQRLHPGVRHLLRGELRIRQDDQAADSGAQVGPAAPPAPPGSADVSLRLGHRRKVFLRRADSSAVTLILTFLHQSAIQGLFLDSFCFCCAAAK